MNLPSYSTLINQKLVLPSNKKPFVAVDEHFLQALLIPLLKQIRVDEYWYTKKYSDVDQAIQQGLVDNAHAHYFRFGYFEHRFPYPIPINEDWYLKEYPDVKDAVSKKHFASAQHHFETVGFREGRFPSANFQFDLAISDGKSSTP